MVSPARTRQRVGLALGCGLVRGVKMPMVMNLEELMTSAGFAIEDINIGFFGIQHLYVATKAPR